MYNLYRCTQLLSKLYIVNCPIVNYIGFSSSLSYSSAVLNSTWYMSKFVNYRHSAHTYAIRKRIAEESLKNKIVKGASWSFIDNIAGQGPFLNYSIKEQVRDILSSFGVALSMAIPVFAMSFIPMNPFILLPLQVAVGAAITIGICEAAKLPEYVELKGIALPIINKIDGRK